MEYVALLTVVALVATVVFAVTERRIDVMLANVRRYVANVRYRPR